MEDPHATRSGALDLLERAAGLDNLSTTRAIRNLAFVLDNEGRYEECMYLFKRSLASYERMVGPNHPATADILLNLGQVYPHLGLVSDAAPLIGRALQAYENAVGQDRPNKLLKEQAVISLRVNKERKRLVGGALRCVVQ